MTALVVRVEGLTVGGRVHRHRHADRLNLARDATYGRIGVRGRTIRHIAGDAAEARTIIRRHLRRRATSPRRIGVAYRLCELADTGQWRLAIPLPLAAKQGDRR